MGGATLLFLPPFSVAVVGGGEGGNSCFFASLFSSCRGGGGGRGGNSSFSASLSSSGRGGGQLYFFASLFSSGQGATLLFCLPFQ